MFVTKEMIFLGRFIRLTVGACAMIASWNFRHIVHYEKMEKYNAVNTLQGFGHIAIHSPLEIVDYENEDEGV